MQSLSKSPFQVVIHLKEVVGNVTSSQHAIKLMATNRNQDIKHTSRSKIQTNSIKANQTGANRWQPMKTGAVETSGNIRGKLRGKLRGEEMETPVPPRRIAKKKRKGQRKRKKKKGRKNQQDTRRHTHTHRERERERERERGRNDNR